MKEIHVIRRVVSQGSGFSWGMVTKGERSVLIP